ncbi:MAG: ribonuclease protein component [Variibacter sp.]|jgi:ribonuclease P protein component|nr:ribonuclease protein component [Variibacter sp.]
MDRLRQRADFLATAAGLQTNSRAFLVQARRREDTRPARVGLTVSRKVGSAVERNRARRRLRSVLRAAADAPEAGHDYVLVARRSALTVPFGEMVQDFVGALRRIADGKARPSTKHPPRR